MSQHSFNEIAWSYTNTSDISQAKRVYFYNKDGNVESDGHLIGRSNHSDTNTSFSLLIYNLRASDEGLYVCSRTGTSVLSANITLIIIGIL